MTLPIDIGNTRIKWARFENGVLQPQSAAPHADWSAQTLTETVLQRGGRSDRVLVSNVAGPRMADVVHAGKLRIGMFPSFQFSRDAAGNPRGLAPDIATALSKRLGIAEVIVVEFLEHLLGPLRVLGRRRGAPGQ